MRLLSAVSLVIVLLSAAAYAQSPVITGHTVNSMRTVEFVFSHTMYRTSVEAPANLALYPTGSPGDPLETWTVYLLGDRITMSLKLIEPMVSGTSYTLALDGMQSTTGDYVAEGYEYIFTATDIVAPELNAVTFHSPGEIDLVFSEDMVESEGEDISNYTLFETAAPGNTIGIVYARMRGIYDRVFFDLDQDLVPGTGYTITAAGLHDISGNPLPGGSEFVFTYTGTNSRTMMGLYADFDRRNSTASGTGQYSYDMWFWVRPSATGAYGALFSINYPENVIPHYEELNPDFESIPAGNIYSGVAVVFDGCASDWIWMYRQTVTVTDDQQSLISIYPIEDQLERNILFFECDYARATIPMDVTSNIEINAPDARPVAVEASFSGNTIIDITFSIPMDQTSSETIPNYEVFETASPGNVVSIASANLQANGRTVRLIASAALTAGTEYSARLTGVESSAGIAIYPGSEIAFSAIDEELPYLISAARTGQLTVDVLFNEPVDPKTANSVLNYDIVLAADHNSHIELSSASLLEDGMTVRLTVNSHMEDGTLYTVFASNVKDLWDNVMHYLGSADFTADDVYFPAILSICSVPGNIIEVNFDEPLDSATAVDPDNYWLRRDYTAGPIPLTSVVWGGNHVTITVNASLELGTHYHLKTRIIEDDWGNAVPEWESFIFIYTPESPEPQIGLWADGTRTFNSIRVYPYETFEYYIWIKPGPTGISAMEYAIENTSLQNFEYYPLSYEFNPDHAFSTGDVYSGITSVVYGCKNDWFWITKVNCIMIDGRGYIDLIPHPLGGGPQATICISPSYPIVQLKKVSRMFINEWLISTLLQNSTAEYIGTGIEVTWELAEIDEKVEFIVSRKKTGKTSFDVLASPSISKDEMRYTFIDTNIEKGSSYIYRIDYPEDGETRTLFETEEISTPAMALTLSQNCPNPFNPSTNISYYLPTSCNVRLEIFDASGRLVTVLQDGVQNSGSYNVDWNGTNSIGNSVSSGIYFYRITADKETISKKMVLLR